MRGASFTTHFEPLHKLYAHQGKFLSSSPEGRACFDSCERLVTACSLLGANFERVVLSPGKYILKCLLSPDVRQLATTSADKTVKLWNLDGFTLECTLSGETSEQGHCNFLKMRGAQLRPSCGTSPSEASLFLFQSFTSFSAFRRGPRLGETPELTQAACLQATSGGSGIASSPWMARTW